MNAPRRGQITSRHVAARAGVSQSTVSRVLTGDTRVAAATRERVLRVLKELQYEPNLAARAMKTGRTGHVGVVMSSITNPFHQELLQELSGALVAVGLHTVIWHADRGADVAAVQAIRQRRVDGVIFTAADADSEPLAAAIDEQVPVVLLHRMLEGVPCDQVGGDNWAGGRDVARYFLDHGHRRVALVSGSLRLSTTRDREMGFRAGLAERGVELAPGCVARGAFTHTAGQLAARRMLELPDPPTAIFATGDILAFGLIDGVREMGRRTPDDVWVVGFDNTEMAAWTSFDLTSVDQPQGRLVEVAVGMLRERIADPSRVPQQMHFPCDLVVRGTTGGAAAQREHADAAGADAGARDGAWNGAWKGARDGAGDGGDPVESA